MGRKSSEPINKNTRLVSKHSLEELSHSQNDSDSAQLSQHSNNRTTLPPQKASLPPLNQETKVEKVLEPQYEVAILRQERDFLQQQVLELEQKLKKQELIYESIIGAYKAQEAENPSTITPYSRLNVFYLQISKQESGIVDKGETNKQLAQQLKETEGAKGELEIKLQKIEQELHEKINKYKYKSKDRKHLAEELQIKLKHAENRNLQKENQYQRLIEDLKESHQSELDKNQEENEKICQQMQEKSMDQLNGLKDIYEMENTNLKNKINELKAQNRTMDIQIQDYQMQIKDKLSVNLEAFEQIHLRYLEEIKNLNMTLASFRQEKEVEIKKFKDQSQQMQEQLKKAETQAEEANKKYHKEKEQCEIKITDMRKKVDQAFKDIAEHEKCEITIQAQKKRISELKQAVQQLELKEKWNWKNLVNKRSQIEAEKADLKRKMNHQQKSERSKAMSQSRVNEEQEKKINILNKELESSTNQKHMLRSKITELERELMNVKKENLNSSVNQVADRSYLARSVSPSQISFIKVFKHERERKNNPLNQTQNNLGKILQRIGSSKDEHQALSPITKQANNKEKNLIVPVPHQSSQACSFVPSPNNFTSVEKEILKGHQCSQNKNPTKKLNQQKVMDYDDSFLSPKLDPLSFLNSSQVGDNSLLKASCHLPESSNLQKFMIKTSPSQFDIRCKLCKKWFEQVEQFLLHQRRCELEQSKPVKENQQDRNSEVPDVNIILSSDDSPKLKRNRSEQKFRGIQMKKSSIQRAGLMRKHSQSKVVPEQPKHQQLQPTQKVENSQPQPHSKTQQKVKTRNQEKIKQSMSDKGKNLAQKQEETKKKEEQKKKEKLVIETAHVGDRNQQNQGEEKTLQELLMIQTDFSEQKKFVPNSTKSEFQNPSLFSQSMMGPQLLTNRDNSEVEAENEHLVRELKQAKIDLAISQEQSAANELHLKKEILNLQIQINSLLQPNSCQSRPSTSNASSFVNNAHHIPQSSQVIGQANNGLSSYNPFSGANINISTTNVTCYNIGYQNNQEYPYNCLSPPSQSQQQDQSTKDNFSTNTKSVRHMRPFSKPSGDFQENFKELQEKEEVGGGQDQLKSKEKNQQIRVGRVPTLIQKK